MRMLHVRVAVLLFVIVMGAAPLRGSCTVSCSATVPSSASTGATVSFQSTGTACACSSPPAYYWTFGDGADSTAQNPSHAYASAGTYNWQLTVTSDATTCTKSGSIVIGAITPAAGTYSGTTSAGQSFSITVNGSSQITNYSIGYAGLCGGTGSVSVTTTCSVSGGTFSCGSASCIPFSTQTSISGTFTSPSAVSGSATLKSMPDVSTCCTQTPTFSATLSPGPLAANASSDVSSGQEPLMVNFTGSASGGTSPYAYSWDFGDCSATSSAQNPSHSYAVGNWNAVLTVTDSAMATATDVVPISATPGPGVTVTPASGLTTTEGGGTATFNVVLNAAAGADVTIEIHSSDTTEGLVSHGGAPSPSITLTFTTGNWSTPQTVTVTGQNDAIDDGDVGYTIVTSATDSTDLTYDGIDGADVSATNIDNDTAGVTVAPTSVSVNESATTATFDVSLATEPNGTVVINLASTDTGEATVSPAQLTFSSSAAQTVTVTGVDDAIRDFDQTSTINVTIDAPLTTDAAYDPLDPADVTVTTVDDDELRIVATNPLTAARAASRNANITATTSHNVNAATLTASTWRMQGEMTGRLAGAYSGSGTSLQFNPTNDFKPGETIKVSATSGIASSGAIALTPRVWQFNASAGSGSAALMRHPLKPSFEAGIVNAISLGDLDGDGDLDAVFADGGGGAPEEVWLNDGTGVYSRVQQFGAGDTYEAALGDLDGDGDLDVFCANRLTAETVWLNDGSGHFSQHGTTVDSNWTLDVALGDVDGDGDLDAVAAGSEGENVWLNDGSGAFSAHPTAPTFGTQGEAIAMGDVDADGDLDVVVANGGFDRVWKNDGTGVFTGGNTMMANGFDVALGDVDGDGDLDAVFAATSAQPQTVWANDGNGTFSSLSSFGAGDSRAVVLGDLDGDGDLDAIVANAGTEAETLWLNDGAGNFSAHPATPTFNPGTESWGVALGDIDGDGDLDAIVANTLSPGQDETVWLNERVLVTQVSSTTTEAGGTATFTVSLGKQPAANVTITITSGDVTEGRLSTDGVTQQNSVNLTFTNANWNTPRTVTVHGQNDDIDDGDITFAVTTSAATSTDPFFSGASVADLSFTNTDNDTAGVNVSPASVTVAESGTMATFAVSLATQPNGTVVIDLASLDTGEATVSPAQLTFNSATAQTVTVTGVDDAIDDGNQLTTIALTINAAATTDSAYDPLDPPDVTTTTTDDEKTATTTSLGSSPNPSLSGQSVTFTATVTAGATGTVTFKEGATTLGTSTLSGTTATFTTAFYSVGTHAVTAQYNGDANYLGSTSSAANQVVNASSFGAPPYLSATAASSTSVTVTWGAVSGATSYEVHRATSFSGPYTLAGTTGSNAFGDTGRTANTTYLYKVRAIGSGGPSAFSAIDVATTTIFTDAAPALIRQLHITELRTAVNAMRAAAGLAAATFTDPTPTTIKRLHIVELRTALDAARSAMSLSALSYTDPTITAGSTKVKAVHVTQLRGGVM